MIREAAKADVDRLTASIVATVTYRDLFDYPVTIEEIHRYLHLVPCHIEDIRAALSDVHISGLPLAHDGTYFALHGRDELFERRRRREKRSRALWPVAHKLGRRLAGLPFVRMVAVTGSLAVDNPGDDADVDFMLVTEPGRVWTVRLMAKVLQYLDARFSTGELCVNHVISTRALELEGQGLYTAQEVAQMVPLYGPETYTALRKANRWVLEFLPNADGPPPSRHAMASGMRFWRRLGEWILKTPPGNAIESWECRRKLHKYNATEFLLGRATRFRPEATGHRRSVREAIENAFADRLEDHGENALRILFGQAYHLHFDPKLWHSMQPFPPLGSLYAASVARSLGHIVRVHDSMLSVSIGEWAASVQINRPDVVVLYEDNFNYLTKMCLLSMRDAALKMIRIAKQQHAKVVVCSSDSADEPRLYLDAGADYILAGEGEATLRELLVVLSGESEIDVRQIPGLAYLENDQLVSTPKRPVIRHIDALPLPAWDLIDLERYSEIWRRRHGCFALNLVTTRGCPYHCNWCAKPIWGQRYNARSPENVVEELAWLRHLAEFDRIWFMDDIFGLKPGWITRFADALDAAGLAIRFKCLSRPDLLLRDGETAALARAGCDIVWMGAESGSQKILDAMEKGTTVEMIESASRLLREQDIRVGMFIQFGYPGESRSDIRKTIALIRRIMPDELGISVSYPLPGTRFFDRVKEQLGNTRHWQDSDDLAMLFKGPFSTGYYRALHAYVHSDLAVRRAWSDNRWPLLGYALVKRTWLWLMMGVLSRIPHRGSSELPAGMGPEAAATPSEQPAD